MFEKYLCFKYREIQILESVLYCNMCNILRFSLGRYFLAIQEFC